MSLSATLPAILLDLILGRLALLFITATTTDPAAARQAATEMLAAYAPETPAELRLAAEIISFGLHALEALSQASHPDMSLTKILRLRGSAVSLSRESHKSQRKLDQLQRDRRAGIHAEPAAAETAQQTEPPRPRVDKAIALIEATRQTLGSQIEQPKTWTQAYRQRQTAKRIAENLKKNQTAHALNQASQAASLPA
jgi:hypothetical protein